MTTPSDDEVEKVARSLAKASTGASNVYRMSWWNEKLLNWSLSRPAFKSQLFRFVDVFPGTHGSKDVMGHVQEYLGGDEVPAMLRSAVRMASLLPFGASVTASQARKNISRMADQFILGTTADQAVKGARKLWNEGSGTIVDLLGEKTVAEPEADAYAARVLGLLEALCESSSGWKSNPMLDHDHRGPVPRVGISIKPTALASRYAPLSADDGLRQAKDRLRPILRRAKDRGAFVWFDMEHYEVKDVTIRLFKELLDEPRMQDLTAGLVMQAYLKDTYGDIASLVEWSAARSLPVSVRLVKGAYWDTETIKARAHDWPVPVFEHKSESDANYERCTRLLLEHHGEITPAFASHNLRSLAYAIACARVNGVPENGFEIQMLYGMAEPMHAAVRESGIRLRVYAPVGELVPGMAYLVRRLLENTSNDSFVRLRFAEGKELSSLIAAPEVEQLPAPDDIENRKETNPENPDSYEPEPLAQWHKSDVRKEMEKKVGNSEVAGNPPYVHAVIDGERITTDSTIPSLNPAFPSQIVAVSAACNNSHVDVAVSVAKEAFTRWSRTPAKERAEVLFKAAGWMRSHRFELAALEVREAGKPWSDADGDVCEAIDFCEYYGREILKIDSGGQVQSPPGEANALRYQPRGVGAVIAPWNFPLAIPMGMTSAALVTGNTVVLKPAEQTPAIAAKIVEAFDAAGLPKGVLNFVPGLGEPVGAPLVAHPDVTFIAFTGSRPVGMGILESAAKFVPGQRHIKKVILELGGKNPMIVDSDADLDQAVPAIVASAFGFAGQKCSALSRLIVVDAVKDQLHERLIGAVQGLSIGDPAQMNTDVPPVIDAEAHHRILDIVAEAPAHGNVAIWRQDVPERGYFVGPTVVTDVNPMSSLARDEVFGPVLATLGASDIDAALELANATDYALTAGIFSRSPSNIAYLASEIRAGNVYINRSTTGAVVGRQPFGGWGMSGGGTKAGGPDYLLNFMDPRTITENTVRQGFAELS